MYGMCDEEEDEEQQEANKEKNAENETLQLKMKLLKNKMDQQKKVGLQWRRVAIVLQVVLRWTTILSSFRNIDQTIAVQTSAVSIQLQVDTEAILLCRELCVTL